MQFYLINKKCPKAEFLFPNGSYSSQKYLIRPLIPFVDNFFSKLYVILHIGRIGYLEASELWSLARPGMILKKKFPSTYRLQLLSSSNGKKFLKKIKKPLKIS